MNHPEISFFNEDIEMPNIDLEKINVWLFSLIEKHNYVLEELNYIFCSDEYLLQINQEYLNHDYFTDIITFDNSEEEETIVSDIFISIDRVTDNANSMNNNLELELLRVLSHGLLHLFGYKDKTDIEAQIMRTKEDESINKYLSKNK